VAVKIKLKRMGKIRAPYYRIIVADSRTKRDGRAIEEIGKYHPKDEPSLIQVESERAQYWLSVGAQPTDPVRRILEITGDWQRFRGEDGAEGTLRTAEPKQTRAERFAEVAGARPAGGETTAKGGGRGKKSDTDSAKQDKPAGGSRRKPDGKAKAADAKAADTKAADTKGRAEKAESTADATATKATEAKATDTKAADAKAGDTKAADAKAGDTKAADAKAGDTKAADAKAGDTKTADAKATDAKATDAKATEATASDTKAADADAKDAKAADAKADDKKTAKAEDKKAEAKASDDATVTAESGSEA
jgi:small subunit ribosomal protein S16